MYAYSIYLKPWKSLSSRNTVVWQSLTVFTIHPRTNWLSNALLPLKSPHWIYLFSRKHRSRNLACYTQLWFFLQIRNSPVIITVIHFFQIKHGCSQTLFPFLWNVFVFYNIILNINNVIKEIPFSIFITSDEIMFTPVAPFTNMD